MTEEEYEERKLYTVKQEEAGFSEGEVVAILSGSPVHNPRYVPGWACSWTEEMTSTQGHVGRILKIDYAAGVQVEVDDYVFYYPFYMLKKVTKKEDCKMEENNALEESYLVLQDEFAKNVPVGSTVLITRSAKNCELGWQNVWPLSCNEVGKVYTIESYSKGGVTLNNSYAYPFFVLELVQKAPKEKVPLKEAADIAQYIEKALENYTSDVLARTAALKKETSVDEVHSIKKWVLRKHLNVLHVLLTPKGCVYCLVNNRHCSECDYGKRHGMCTCARSDFETIVDALAELENAIDNY